MQDHHQYIKYGRDKSQHTCVSIFCCYIFLCFCSWQYCVLAFKCMQRQNSFLTNQKLGLYLGWLFISVRLWSIWNIKKRISRQPRWTLYYLLWQGKSKEWLALHSGWDFQFCLTEILMGFGHSLCALVLLNEGRAARRWNILAIRVAFCPRKHVMGCCSSMYCNVGYILSNTSLVNFVAKSFFLFGFLEVSSSMFLWHDVTHSNWKGLSPQAFHCR
jgi:hypothetical protein